jgi:hypothetical protein
LINFGDFNNQVCDMLPSAVSVVTDRTVVVFNGGALQGKNVHVLAGLDTPETRVHLGKILESGGVFGFPERFPETFLIFFSGRTRDCLCASLHKSVGIEQNRWYRSVRTTVYV